MQHVLLISNTITGSLREYKDGARVIIVNATTLIRASVSFRTVPRERLWHCSNITDGEKGAKREIITPVKRWRNVHGGIRKSLRLITMSRSRLRAYYNATNEFVYFKRLQWTKKTQLHTMIQRTCLLIVLTYFPQKGKEHFARQIRRCLVCLG